MRPLGDAGGGLDAADFRLLASRGFGNRGNVTVFEMAEFDGHLYAGTVNPFTGPFTGFGLWKTDGEGGPPYRWRRVLQRGAWRGVHNEVVGSLCAFNGALY